MNNSRSTLLVFCVTSAISANVLAAESGWKLPNLNPFSKKSPATTSHTISDMPQNSWQLPKLPKLNLKPPKIDLLPKWGQTKTSKPSQPSAWDKFTDGTKNFLGKTKETLASPFKSPSTRTSRPTGGTSGHQFGRTEKRPERKSLFTGWLTTKKEEPKRPEAPHDFLKRPRPEF